MRRGRRRRRRVRPSAGAEELLESSLLGRGDGEVVGGLDLDPGGGVVAVDAGQGRRPLVGGLVALGRVGGAGDGPELGAGDVVGEGLALGGGPLRGAGLRRGGELVSISVGRGRGGHRRENSRPRRSSGAPCGRWRRRWEGRCASRRRRGRSRSPRSGSSRCRPRRCRRRGGGRTHWAGGCQHTGPALIRHGEEIRAGIPGVARSLTGDRGPVGEEVAVVGAVVVVGSDGEAGEQGAGRRLGRNAGRESHDQRGRGEDGGSEDVHGEEVGESRRREIEVLMQVGDVLLRDEKAAGEKA